MTLASLSLWARVWPGGGNFASKMTQAVTRQLGQETLSLYGWNTPYIYGQHASIREILRSTVRMSDTAASLAARRLSAQRPCDLRFRPAATLQSETIHLQPASHPADARPAWPYRLVRMRAVLANLRLKTQQPSADSGEALLFSGRIKSWRIRFGDGRGLFLLLMVPNLILSILFWRVQAYDALTVSALLVDRVLQIASALFPISLVVVLVSPVRVARVGAVVGSLCSALLGLSASVNALRPPIDLIPTMLALVCLIIGLVWLVWLTHKVMLASRWQFSVLGLLALLPIIQFWHQTSFVPGRLVTSMSITPAVVEVVNQTASDNRVGLQFQLQNASEVGALILSS